MTSMSEQVTEGAAVRKVNSRGHDRTISQVLKVSKVGKRVIVLDDKSRFNAVTLREQGRDFGGDRLVLADSDEAREIRDEQIRRHRYSRLLAAVSAPTRRNRTSDYTSAELDVMQAALHACRAALPLTATSGDAAAAAADAGTVG